MNTMNTMDEHAAYEHAAYEHAAYEHAAYEHAAYEHAGAGQSVSPEGQESATETLPRSVPAHPTRATAWWDANRAALLEVLVVFVGSIIGLNLVAGLAVGFLPEQSGELHSTFHRSNTLLVDVWNRWDSEYYLDVAQYSYALRPQLTNFFPLYPLLVSTVAHLTGEQYPLGGVLVSALSYFAALFYLFKLAAFELDGEAAGRSILYLALYPMALFMLAVYTESLFLAITIAAFYYMRRGHWVTTGVLAFLATLTRPNGFVILLPIAYEAWRQRPRGGLSMSREQWFAIVAAPAGVLLWGAYLWWLSGDPLAFVHSRTQPPFERTVSMPWDTLIYAVQNLLRSDLTALSRMVNTTDLVAALGLVAATLAAWRYLPRAYAVYTGATALLLFSSTVPDWPLQSMPRYTLSVFPIFLLLARLGANRHWHRLILMVGAPLLGMYTALFATWYWVF